MKSKSGDRHSCLVRVHTDLLKNELISDPFVGTNELGLQWIDKKFGNMSPYLMYQLSRWSIPAGAGV